MVVFNLADVILAALEELQGRGGRTGLNASELKRFVDEHFEEEGHELISTTPKDWRKKLQL